MMPVLKGDDIIKKARTCAMDGPAALTMLRACEAAGVQVAPSGFVHEELGLWTTRDFATDELLFTGVSAAGRWLPAAEAPHARSSMYVGDVAPYANPCRRAAAPFDG